MTDPFFCLCHAHFHKKLETLNEIVCALTCQSSSSGAFHLAGAAPEGKCWDAAGFEGAAAGHSCQCPWPKASSGGSRR